MSGFNGKGDDKHVTHYSNYQRIDLVHVLLLLLNRRKYGSVLAPKKTYNTVLYMLRTEYIRS